MPTQSAYIEVDRVGGKWADRTRAYRVVVDDYAVGKVDAGETARFEVTPGAHLVYLKIDWCRSEKLAVEVAAGETARLGAEARNPWGAIYWISFGCRSYMKLWLTDGSKPRLEDVGASPAPPPPPPPPPGA